MTDFLKYDGELKGSIKLFTSVQLFSPSNAAVGQAPDARDTQVFLTIDAFSDWKDDLIREPQNYLRLAEESKPEDGLESRWFQNNQEEITTWS